jgi:hypothetical protein
MDDAEVALSKALLAVIVGVRREVTTEEVAMALEDAHGLAPGSYSVHCHRPEDFLLYFATREARDRVLADGVLASPFFRLLLRPWSWRTHVASGGLCVHTELEIEGVPANAWSLATAEAVLAPTALVERLHPLTRSRADMGVLRLSAWCLDPAPIPREVDLHVVEPDVPPTAADMAAPATAVVPPHISTLVYPLLVHVTRTTDFRRDTPGGAASGDGNGGRTAGWPKRRQYQYTRGVPDVLPGGAGGEGAAPAAGQSGGGRVGSTRTLASGAVVEFDRSMSQAGKGKRRRRAGRKVQALRAKARAAVQSAGLVGCGGAAVSASPLDASSSGHGGLGGAADFASPLDATGSVPLLVQGLVKDGTVVVRATDSVDEGVAVEASHMGAGLRIGSNLIPVVDAALLSPSRPGPPSIQLREHGSAVERTATASLSHATSMLGHSGCSPGPFSPRQQCTALVGGGDDAGQAQQGTLRALAERQMGQAQDVADDAEAPAAKPRHSNAARENGEIAPPVDVDVAKEASLDSPVLQLAVAVNAEGADSSEAHKFGVEDFDGEQVDEEIVVDTPPARGVRDVGLVPSPSLVSPAVCRFASPPVVFQRSRQPPYHRHRLPSPDLEL